MASTLQVMSMAAAVQSQAVAAGVAPAPAPSPLATLFGCSCGGAATDYEDDLEAQQNDEGGPETGTAPPMVTLYLRLCIYAATDLPAKETTYIEAVINEGKEDELKFKTPSNAGDPTVSPVYKFEWEAERGFTSSQAMELTLMATRSIGGDVALGKAVLNLAAKPHEPKFLTLSFAPVHSALMPKAFNSTVSQGKLTLVYQLVKSNAFAPSLLTIADLGPDCTEKGEWMISTVVHAVGLKDEQKNPIVVRAQLYQPADEKGSDQQSRDSPSLKLDKLTGENNYKDTFGTDDKPGWSVEFASIQGSQATLMNYVLRLELYVQEEKRGKSFLGLDDTTTRIQETKLGLWREGLFDIFSAAESCRSRLRFDAAINNGKDVYIGLIRLDIDVYRRHAHGKLKPMAGLRLQFDKSIRAMDKTIMNSKTAVNIVGATELTPIRLGMPREVTWQKPIIHYITVAADGLAVPQGCDSCNPFVKITIGGITFTSAIKENQANNVEWEIPIVARARVIDRVAKVAICDAPGLVIDDSCEVLCQGYIYDVRQGAEYCLHCMGAAIDAPKKDLARMMTEGVIQPASTYRGTVMLCFSSSKRETKPIFHNFKQSRRKGQLNVRMYTGNNFTCFAGKKVTVNVRIPGCRLPDHQCKTAEDGKHPRRYNRNLLSFEGHVDADGSLTLAKDNKAYAERATPSGIHLAIPPNAFFAHVYIHAKGADHAVPPVFGIMPLVANAEDEVIWHRMRFDKSVADTPPAHFPSDCAGYILGMARVTAISPLEDAGIPTPDAGSPTNAGSPTWTNAGTPKAAAVVTAPHLGEVIMSDGVDSRTILPAESAHGCCASWVATGMGSPGEELDPPAAKPRRHLYCHVDMLAARNLPTDDDGSCAAAFTIRVNKKVFHQTADIFEGTDPQFMKRICIPIDVLQGDSHAELPLPPILVSLTNCNNTFGKKMGGSGQLIGSCVVVARAGAIAIHGKDAHDELDLDKLHEAVWLSLDTEKRADFLPTKLGGVDSTWLKAPRILLAACFSESPYVKGTSWPSDVNAGTGHGVATTITSSRVEGYQIELNLLGLRNLPDKMFNPELVVNCSALKLYDETGSAPMTFPLTAGERNTNFGPCAVKDGDVNAMKKQLEYLVSVVDDLDPADDDFNNFIDDHSSSSAGKKPKAVKKPTAELPAVPLSSFVGEKIIAPSYEAPVLDYLQPKHEGVKEPFVLLPNIGFTIRNSMTGNVYATATAMLGNISSHGGGPHYSDWQHVAQVEFGALMAGEYWPPRTMVEAAAGVGDDWYQVSIDVFAARNGYLKFDPDSMVGRILMSHELFSISESSEEDKNPITQYFNPWDFMAGNALFESQAFDERVMPAFECPQRAAEQNKMPVDPNMLFKPILSGSGGFYTKTGARFKNKKEFIERASTGDFMRNALKKGYRCVSHQVAPEPETKRKPNGPPGSDAVLKQHLDQNTHTFIRPVGHCIVPGDRGSRFLARLQMVGGYGKPSPPFPDNLCRNFAVFKFKNDTSGVVVWVAPEEVTRFTRPGQPIMAVELQDGSGTVVIIRLPSLDVRFPFEQFWACKKTCRVRSSDNQNSIKAHEKSKEVRKKLAAESKNKMSAAEQAERMNDTKPNTPQSKTLSPEEEELMVLKADIDLADEVKRLKDGMSQPIWVNENGFVLRFTFAKGSTDFMRVSTDKWYSDVLRNTFPELSTQSADNDLVHEWMEARMLNLRLPFNLLGQENPGTALTLLKGHVRILPRTFKRDDSGQIVKVDMPEPPILKLVRSIMPADLLWTRETIWLRLCALTAHDLQPAPASGKIYVQLKIGDHIQRCDNIEVAYNNGSTTSLRVYANFKLEVTMPGASSLLLEVWDAGIMLPSLLGTTEIDLEERWLFRMFQRMRARGNQEFLASTVWPKKPAAWKLEVPVEVEEEDAETKATARCVANPERKGVLIRPTVPKEVPVIGAENIDATVTYPLIPPLEPNPVELLDLKTGSQANIEVVGQLRVIMRMDPDTADRNTSNLVEPSQMSPFEIRIFVGHVENIQVFKDNERNDVYVKLDLLCRDLSGKEFKLSDQTTVHKYAVNRATFNHLFVFPIVAPCVVVNATFTLTDDDLVSGDDIIYNPVKLCLDDVVSMALENAASSRPPPGMLPKKVIFNSWDNMHAKPSCCARCCRRCCRCCFVPALPNSKKCAEMHIQVEVVPMRVPDYVAKVPGVTREPMDRLTWRTAAANPSSTMVALIGPTAVLRGKCVCMCLVPLICLLLLALVIVLLLYYVGHLNILLNP